MKIPLYALVYFMHIMSHKTVYLLPTTKPFALTRVFLVVSVVFGGLAMCNSSVSSLILISQYFSAVFPKSSCVSNWVLSLQPAPLYTWKKFLVWVYFLGLISFFYPTLLFPSLPDMMVLGGWAGGGLASSLFPPKLRYDVICYWCATFKSSLEIWKRGLFPRILQKSSWRLCCVFPQGLWLHSTLLILLWMCTGMGGWGKGRCTWCPEKGNVFLLLPRQMSGKAKTQ